MNPLKICFASAEVAPFAISPGSGQMAELSRMLPIALKEMSMDIRLMMPKYKAINERKYVLREVIRLREVNIEMGGQTRIASAKTAFLPDSKVHVYFLSVPDFFDRKGIYQDPRNGRDFSDNPQRFANFCRGVLETLKLLYWQPDIIHCSDWSGALIPFYLRTYYKDDPFFQKTHSLLSIHDPAALGHFSPQNAADLGIPKEMLSSGGDFTLAGKPSLLRAGMAHADMVTLQGEALAQKLVEQPEQLPELQDILRSRSRNIAGVPGGIDYSVWNPETDAALPSPYDSKSVAKKVQNKEALLQSHGLGFSAKVPLVGVFIPSGGKELQETAQQSLRELLKLNAIFIAFGDDHLKGIKAFQKLAGDSPEKLICLERVDSQKLHELYGGLDVLLHLSPDPDISRLLIALQYGVVPVAMQTLTSADALKAYDPETGKGTGFFFTKFESANILSTFKKILKLFSDEKAWSKVQKAGMREDFSWEACARKYLKLYEKAIHKR